MEQVGWVGKNVFIKTSDNKFFQGRVVFETETKITLLDKFGLQVELSKIDLRTCKEEF